MELSNLAPTALLRSRRDSAWFSVALVALGSGTIAVRVLFCYDAGRRPFVAEVSSEALTGLIVLAGLAGAVVGIARLALLMRVSVELDSTGFAVSTPFRRASGEWREVSRMAWIVVPKLNAFASDEVVLVLWVRGRRLPFGTFLWAALAADHAGLPKVEYVDRFGSWAERNGIAYSRRLPDIPWYAATLGTVALFLLVLAVVGFTC